MKNAARNRLSLGQVPPAIEAMRLILQRAKRMRGYLQARGARAGRAGRRVRGRCAFRRITLLLQALAPNFSALTHTDPVVWVSRPLHCAIFCSTRERL